METFVQPKITGYRQLNEAEAALMNEIKAEGVKLGELVAKLRATEGLDQRWVSIGATDLQTGLMALTRGVAQPTTFACRCKACAPTSTPPRATARAVRAAPANTSGTEKAGRAKTAAPGAQRARAAAAPP